MKKISVENMSTIQGGNWCTFNKIALTAATISLYAAPFTGGSSLAIGLGLLTFASFVGAAYATGAAC